MNEIIRNLTRRKLRSALTISGIVIGIFALTAMGAIAENFNALIGGGVHYLSVGISVGVPDGQQAGLLPLSKMSELQRVRGVDAVVPTYSTLATPGGGVSFGAPDMIANEDVMSGSRGLMPGLTAGRSLSQGTNGEVVLGSTMATELGKHAGDRIDLPVRPKGAGPDFVNHPFTVVGILARTGTAPDTTAFVNDADARMLLRDSLAPTVRAAVDVDQVAQGFTVYPKAGTPVAEMDRIADRINAQVPGVKANRPSELINNFQSINSTMDAVIVGSAVLALVIGSLSVVNTMIMAVTERVREIGLKKALGAHTGHVLREYLLEASLIGLIGGGVGFALGAGLTSLIAAFGTDLFLITPRLTVLAIGFAVVLGALAGLVPAIRAARLDPVSALRTSN